MDLLALTLEKLNLVPVFLVATMFASMISIYIMQVTSSHGVNSKEPLWVQNIHRAILMLIALTFVWMISFSFDRSWQPWPPMLILVILYDALMVVRAYLIHLKCARAAKRLKDSRHRSYIESAKWPR
jgi:cell division protein FtsW (lipid II flippase)